MSDEVAVDTPAEGPPVEVAKPKPKPKKGGPKRTAEAAKATKSAPAKKVAAKATPKPAKALEPAKATTSKLAIRQAAEMIKQAADATRLAILLLLRDGPINVGDICSHVGQLQPAVSHHLAIMRHGGMVQPDRRGKMNFYGLTERGKMVTQAVAAIVGL